MLGSITMGSNNTKLFIREDWDQMLEILILSDLSKKLFVSRQKILRKRSLSRFHRQSQCPNSWIDGVPLMLTPLIFPLERYQPLTVWLPFLHGAWWLFSRTLYQSPQCLWNCRFLPQRAFLVGEFLTQLDGEEPASKMLAPVSHILQERRQLAHDLFQPATESFFAKMVDVMARLCSLHEDKDRRCNSHEGDTVNQTNKPSACTQRCLPATNEPLRSTDFIEPAMDLDTVKPWSSGCRYESTGVDY